MSLKKIFSYHLIPLAPYGRVDLLTERVTNAGEGKMFAQRTVNSLTSCLLGFRKCVAFTLAEVLITLGIIGVVAAMTLPTLITNYQKKVYVSRIQKALSVIQQALVKMKADYGVDSLEDIDFFMDMRQKTAVGDDCYSVASQIENGGLCADFYNEFGRYFKNSKFTNNKGYIQYWWLDWDDGAPEDYSDLYYYILPDGIMFTIKNTTAYSYRISGKNSETREISFEINLDVNGPSKPNTYGYDIFDIEVSTNGKLYYDHSGYTYGIDNIIKNGWKITY